MRALFGYGEKQKLLRALQPYYAGISQTAAVIQSHSEKQGFLKGLYENFYKVYNPKAADKLGVVYIHYGSQGRSLTLDDKLSAIANQTLDQLVHSLIKPDNLGYWIEPGHPDFGQHLPLISEKTKKAKTPKARMAMHIGFEDVEPWPIKRIETPSKRAEGTRPKPVLKSQPKHGSVKIDADTQLTGIPPEAWTYRLGNRSAIDWVLDQHKEKKPRDPTIAAKFNTYRFADYKESMIDLLAKVVRVSVDTVAITSAMQALDRTDWD